MSAAGGGGHAAERGSRARRHAATEDWVALPLLDLVGVPPSLPADSPLSVAVNNLGRWALGLLLVLRPGCTRHSNCAQ